jgi:cytochrome P450
MAQARVVVESKSSSQTVLDAIYDSDLIGPEDKTLARMMAETQALFGAGTETTGNTLSVFTFYVLSQPSILRQLKTELDAAAKRSEAQGMLSSRILGKLPYLQACLKEALRMATGVSGRLPRQNPLAPMSYTAPSGKIYAFPPKTTISMSIRDMHFAPDIFHDPHVFSPERWLNGRTEVLECMEQAFVPFGRGVRACLGLDLAKDELTLMAGNLFRQFEFELYETTERDVRLEHDFFAPFGPKDSKGIQVIAK